MKLLKIEPLKGDVKKYKATFELDNKKTKSVKFGQSGYRDFTLINNKSSKFYISDKKEREKVKANYIQRHSKNENHNAPMTAGALSRHILWNRPTFSASLKDFKKRFNL
jgi:hypothetical protein